ncbi:MAG: zf-HC2 domain-containing protein [Planctomycetes bacterium]|nr:zf-HC2 domain-containing protein [Planctomycetota bacterium]
MITCDRYRDLAELLRDGALDPGEAAEASAHLEGCPACRDREETLEALLAPLAGLPPGPYLPPASPWPRLLPPFAGGSATGFGILLAVLLAGIGGAAVATGMLGGDAGVGTPPPAGPGTGAKPPAAAPRSPDPVPPPEEPPAPPPSSTGSLEGRVVGEDGRGREGVILRLGTLSARTDGTGIFLLEGVESGGARTLLVEAPGVPPLEALLPPLRGGGARAVLEEIRTGAGVEARVRVLGPDGRGVAGARVKALLLPPLVFPGGRPTYAPRSAHPGPDAAPEPWSPGSPSLRSTTADGSGEARIPGLPPGPYTFVVEAEGFATSCLEAVLEEDGSVAPDLVLLTAAALRGRVIDGATGEVVPGARVQALPAVRRPWFDDARWSRYAVAGPDGTFRLGDLPATSLLLAAGAPGGCSWSGGVTVEGGVVEEVQLSILPEEPAEAVLLERGTGRPAAGARFLVTSSGVDIPGGTNRLAEVEVDAEGRLPAGALGRGPFDLLLLRPVPGGPWTSDVFSGVTLGRLPGSQGPVPGRSRGSRPPALPVEVERSLSVEGVLRDGEGRALPGVLVHGLGLALPQWQSTPFPTFAGSAWTRADGTFRMDGLPRGRVLLRTGPSLSSQEDMERIETGGPGVLDLRRGAPEGVVVTGTPGEPVALPPAATASGRVLGPDGEPVPGACLRWRVEVRPGGINERPLLAAEANLVRETAAVGRDGSFTLRGLRRDPAGGEGPAVLLLAASAPGFPLRLQALPFEEGGTTAGLEVRLEPGRTIEGRLRRPDGSPAPGVPLLSLGGPAPRTVRGATREDGTFRLTGLPAGPLLLSAGWQAEEAGRWTLPPRDGLLEKTLPAAAHCSGRVSDPEGRPLEGVLLTWVADGLPTRREGRSEADGSFRIPVPAGAGRLWIENPGGEGGSAWPFLPLEVATPPGGQEGLDLRLERGLPLAGVLRGGRGAPLPGATVSAEFQHRGRRWSRQVVIGPDGQFQVHGLPPGDLLLRLHKGGAGAVVAASAGDLHLQVRLEGGEGAVLAGVATKEFGMPAAMATVVAWASKEPAPSGIATPCDGAGRFRMEAPSGGPLTLLLVDADGLPAAWLDGVVPGEGLRLSPGGGGGDGLRGTVRDRGGAPAAGVAVTALRLREGTAARVSTPGGTPLPGGNPAEIRTIRTGRDGSFHLGNPPGDWVLFSGWPGTAAAPGAPEVRREGDRSPLELGTGEGRTLRLGVGVDDDAPPEACRVAVLLPGFLPAGAPEVRLEFPGFGPSEVPGIPAGRAVILFLDEGGRECGRTER